MSNYIEFPEDGTEVFVEFDPVRKKVYKLPAFGVDADDGSYMTPLGPRDIASILAILTPDGWIYDMATGTCVPNIQTWVDHYAPGQRKTH